MIGTFVDSLETLVSRSRLDRYRPTDRDDLETAVAYLWNVALSESLLPGLSMLEIGIRNAVHRTLTVHAGTEYWFQAVLAPMEMKLVSDVWSTLSKRHGQPPAPGQIVAELTFGFWPSLFDNGYQALWWSNGAALFKATFAFIPPGLPPHQSITRKDVHERVEACQKLRNRMMHHEPIFSGPTRLNRPTLPLADVHRFMLDVIGWIDPTLVSALSIVDRFADVHQFGRQRIGDGLRQQLGID